MNGASNLGISSAGIPRPRATVDGNSPTARSRKAERIDMSVNRFKTDYGIEAVMMGSRGHEKSEQHGDLQGRTKPVAVESQGPRASNNTPAHGAVGA